MFDNLVGGAQSGDHAAFDELYRCAYAPVFRFIYLRVKQRDEAEDLTQDVFIKVLRAMPKDQSASPLPYLFTIARNTVIDWTRKKKPEYNDDTLITIRDPAPDPEAYADLDQEARRVLSVLARLSETDEALVKLKHMDGLSHREIAGIVGKNEEAVRQALSRAMRELRTLLESTDYEVPN